ncbi:MAG: hypothetical protein Q8L47_02950 [bacterium]|nr:hypothetical protein [bacterium]
MNNNKGFASIAVIGFVVLVVAIGGSFGLYYFNKLNNSIFSSRPSVSKVEVDPKIIAQNRSIAIEKISQSIKAISANPGFSYIDSSSFDTCTYSPLDQGFITTGIENICNYTKNIYLGFNGDFKESVLNLHKIITNDHWQGTNRTLPYIIEFYYDRSYGLFTDDLLLNRIHRLYGVNDMPAGFYTISNKEKAQGSGSYYMNVRFFERDAFKNYGMDAVVIEDTGLGLEASPRTIEVYYNDKQPIDLAKMLQNAFSKYEFIVRLTESSTYVREIYYK